MTRYMRWCFLPALALFMSCTTFAPKDRAKLPKQLPAQFSLYSDGAPDIENRWWECFESDELNAFVEEALTNSPSLQQAWSRLAQAEAIAAQQGAGRFPTLGYEGSASVSRDSVAKTTEQSYALGLASSYEVDLWGRIKSQAEAAALDRSASQEQLHTAAMTLASGTAQKWASIVSQRLQTNLVQEQLAANRKSLELVELRFRKSRATALDVYQQRQAVAATESRIPQLELRDALLCNELAALLGRLQFGGVETQSAALPEVGELPAVGLPADVLANRPDVRRAGLNLAAADWLVSVARVDRLPAIRLTASANFGSSKFSDLFDNWFANLAAGVTGPIFDAGRRKAEVARTRAVVEERLAAYRETVINAIKEVEDALVSEQKQRAYIAALDRNLELSRSSYAEAMNRYRSGLSEYLPVLVELVSLQSLERDRVEAQFNLLRYRITLYRALGGSWPEALNPPSTESKEKA
ncbi:MAG: efflux transporter outer membrane subunit [Verrucomicrobia bacterium]|jgi:outer membrane protein, multidrug efflux system|nr:efflux transporter outer membrane subunit [Verrucomicrobiota bacterium]